MRCILEGTHFIFILRVQYFIMHVVVGSYANTNVVEFDADYLVHLDIVLLILS